jgi:UDPglucose 6-dehydrogenase/GDP-mannose 6-dehydrogenase
MRISIIGTGYVGLVTGACLAETGHTAVCVDMDQSKVDCINRAQSPIYERGLDELLARHAGKRLMATTDLAAAVRDSEVTFIAVGTPFDGEKIDLAYVRKAAKQIGAALRGKSSYHVVVVKSTVVPGTTDEIVVPILEAASGRKAGEEFGVAMNPEFLTEGVAVEDFMKPDRLVLGGMDERTISVLDAVYANLSRVPVLRTNNKTAEMIKYASNSVLATCISFSNEIANLCSRLGGVDAAEVMQGVHLARYFTTNSEGGTYTTAPIAAFLYAGCGFGGSCLPKDVKALAAHGAASGQPMPLLETVIAINRGQPRRVIELVEKHFPSLAGVRVSVLGLAFKPDTDDMRESPAIPIVSELLARGARVCVYDPVAIENARQILPADKIVFAASLSDALQDVDAVILETRWKAFEAVADLVGNREPPPLIVDGRRMLDRRAFRRYEGIGL